MIHLGQLSGRKNHPKNPRDKHDIDDFPVVHVDDQDNIVEVVDSDATMPSTERRKKDEGKGPSRSDIEQHIKQLREQGLDDQADSAEEMLL
jgi:hypothetical protein